LSHEIESLYESLTKSGYNLFNSNDSFYNDICSPYTSEKGIDIPMSDRQNEIYNNIKDYTICQNNCSFVNYNSSNKKSKCECHAQIEEIKTETKLINYKNELFISFYKTLKHSNFLVLKCFKLTFSIEGQMNNIGSYIMSAIFLMLIIVIIIHFIIGRKKLHNIILKIIYHKKTFKIFNKKENYDNLNTETKTKKKSKYFKIKTNQKNQKNSIKNNVKNNNNKNIEKNEPPPKQKIKNKNVKRSSFISLYNNSVSNLEDISTKKMAKNVGGSVKLLRYVSPRNKILKNKNNKNNKNNQNKISISKKSLPLSMNSSGKIGQEIKIKNNKRIKGNINKNHFLNEQELNNLNYEEAISLDKRNYFQYYFSLLKKKHLLLFTFYPNDDYNLITMKISLFLLSFSLYFTINGFFFTDETMHNIYINNGDLELLYQIPLILYSSIITSVINIILKQLSLSEDTILKIKNEKNIETCILKSNVLEKRIKIKFIIFYIFSFIFMGFFWYFVSCFCVVYKNTQIILIKDTFLSFGLSMLYPVGLNLIPGIFRILALRDPKKGRKYIYIFSKILALI